MTSPCTGWRSGARPHAPRSRSLKALHAQDPGIGHGLQPSWNGVLRAPDAPALMLEDPPLDDQQKRLLKLADWQRRRAGG